MKVALFGGSYDPPHIGHVLAAAYLTTVAGFERVVVVPVFEHAFDKALLPFEARMSLCRLAFSRLRDIEVSPIESELPRPSYTVTTVSELLARHPDYDLTVVVGSDVLPEIERWHRIDELRHLAGFYALGRRGYAQPGTTLEVLPAVSSTELRGLLRAPHSAEVEQRLQQVVPQKVLEEIRRRGYYR